MIEMTLHAVTVRCETLTQALALLSEWAAMGRIQLPPEPKAVDEKLIAASAYWAKKIDGNFVRDLVETLANAAPPVTPAEDLPRVPEPSKPPKRKASAAPSQRPPRERRCRKCRSTFADKTCARDCPTCRPSNPKKAATTRAAVPAAPAKTSAPAKASAPPQPPVPKRTPDVAAAKGLLGRAPIKPNETTKACSSCGDKTRVSELDRSGRCHDCHPVGEPA